MKGLERDVSDPLKTKIRALKTDMIRIQDFHNDHLICLTLHAVGCVEQFHLRVETNLFYNLQLLLIG